MKNKETKKKAQKIKEQKKFSQYVDGLCAAHLMMAKIEKRWREAGGKK